MAPTVFLLLTLASTSLASSLSTNLNGLNAQLDLVSKNISDECLSLPEVPVMPLVDNTTHFDMLSLNVSLAEATLNYALKVYSECQKTENATDSEAVKQAIADLQTKVGALEQRLHAEETLLAKANTDVHNVQTQIAQVQVKQQSLEMARPKVSQHTWSALNDDSDGGATHIVKYQKQSDTTGLRVSWSGTLGMAILKANWNGCVRWYFTFNDLPCTKPASIDMTMYKQSVAPVTHQLPIHRAASVDGVCRDIKAGEVRISLNAGTCPYYFSMQPGDAMTGWNSPSRLLIEEVEMV